jgi:uncharacterized membrane protein YhdT
MNERSFSQFAREVIDALETVGITYLIAWQIPAFDLTGNTSTNGSMLWSCVLCGTCSSLKSTETSGVNSVSLAADRSGC